MSRSYVLQNNLSYRKQLLVCLLPPGLYIYRDNSRVNDYFIFTKRNCNSYNWNLVNTCQYVRKITFYEKFQTNKIGLATVLVFNLPTEFNWVTLYCLYIVERGAFKTWKSRTWAPVNKI